MGNSVQWQKIAPLRGSTFKDLKVILWLECRVGAEGMNRDEKKK
jgi:hypothetical protein